jgi:hypothetical protein
MTISGVNYKHITIVNDGSRVISEWRHNLEHHLSILHLDVSFTLIFNVYSSGMMIMMIVIHKRNVFIIQATRWRHWA